MSTLFPGALDTGGSLPNVSALSSTLGHASLHDAVNGALIAIETKLGFGSSTPSSGSILRGTGAGTSAWGQVNASTDIATFASSVLLGLLTNPTGTGAAVFGTSPTLVTPTVGSFINAQHSHANAAGGGTLNAANALQAGSVSFANLLSTIFSGQLISYSNAGSAGGTFYYINLGGIKLMWGVTSTVTISGSGAQQSGAVTINLPVSGSFFTTIQNIIPSIGTVPTGTSALSSALQALSGTTTMSVVLNQIAGTNGAAGISVFVIGT
jgi:hypothetical protein